MSFLEHIDLSRIGEVLKYDPQAPLIFSSGLFFFMFLLFLPLYYLLRRQTSLRIIYVALFSLLFYYESSGEYVVLLILAATSDFLIGHALSRSREGVRKYWVALSMCINLGVLAYFKYFNFLGDIGVTLLNELGLLINKPEWILKEWTLRDIFLPAGISFYTFQTMSYIIDIYRGEVKPLNRWIDYLFYVSFFPQLVAGPIVRAKDFVPQIRKTPALGRTEYGEALALIISGLFKKAIISDYISLNFVDRIFDAPALYTGLENLLGAYGYALQIYCDFSGYSDMAIGIALLLGFRFNINFDSPYQSVNITEFWRRWHISLSSWLKDYLYIPLGGNRKGRLRAYMNLLITMLLGGLWHGAALRFIIWGALHGIALAVHKAYRELTVKIFGKQPESNWFKRVAGRLLTFHLVVASWILFRADNMEVVQAMFKQIFTSFHPEVFTQFVVGYKEVFALMVLGFALHFVGHKGEKRFQNFISETPFVVQALILVGLVFCVFQIRSSEIQPFIYFQF